MKYLSFIILSFFSLWGYAWPLDATLESSSPPLRALPGNIGLAPVSLRDPLKFCNQKNTLTY